MGRAGIQQALQTAPAPAQQTSTVGVQPSQPQGPAPAGNFILFSKFCYNLKKNLLFGVSWPKKLRSADELGNFFFTLHKF